MKKTRKQLSTRFFALLIVVVLLLGSIPVSAADVPNEAEDPGYADDAPTETVDESGTMPDENPVDEDNSEPIPGDAPADDGEPVDGEPVDGEPADGEPVDGEAVEGSDDDSAAQDETLPEETVDASAAEADDQAPAEVGDDAPDSDAPQAIPQTAKPKKQLKEKKTATDEVGDEDNDNYSVSYTKEASVKINDTSFSVKGLTKVTVTVKNIESADAGLIRAVVLDDKTATDAAFVNTDGAYELPEYVTRSSNADEKTVTLEINISEDLIDSLISETDGTESICLYFTTGQTEQPSQMTTENRVFYIDEEGPVITAEDKSSDTDWNTGSLDIPLTVTDENDVDTVESDTESATISKDEQDGSKYTLTVTENPSENNVTVTATDVLGNEGTLTIEQNILFDNTAPTLTLKTDTATWGADQVFEVTASDTESGIDAATFLFNNNAVKSVARVGETSDYKVTITRGTNVTGTLTVKDNCGNVSEGLSLTFNKDNVAPNADDITLKFFAVSESNTVDALTAGLFHVHAKGIFGNEDTAFMRVAVDPNGDAHTGSPITEIAVSNGDSALAPASATITFEDGKYYLDFPIPVTSDENILNNLTFQIKDAAQNKSAAIKLSKITKIKAGSENLGKAIEKIVNTSVSPDVAANSETTTNVYVNNTDYYAATGSVVGVKATDAIGKIYKVKAWFDQTSNYDSGAPTNDTAVITGGITGLGDDFNVGADGYATNTKDDEKDEVAFTYTIPAGLSGDYTLYVEAFNYTEKNSGTFSRTFHIDNNEPQITDIEHSNVWINTDDTLTFTVTDKPDTNASGVKKVTVNNTEITETDGEYSFTMETRQDYTIVATDNLGNKKTVTVAKADVMIDKFAPNISDFRYGDSGETDIKKVDWATAENGIRVEFDIDDIVKVEGDPSNGDSLSGLDAENVTVTGGEVSDFSYTYDETAKVYTYSFIAHTYAKYTVSCQDLVTNETKNTSEKTTSTIKIDKDAPEITGVSFSKSVGDAILSVLTFGLYSNETINMTVHTNDSAPSSSVKSVIVKINGNESDLNGTKAIEADPDKATEAITEDFGFTVEKKTLSHDKKIIFTVTDNAGNVTEKSLYDIRHEAKVDADGKAVNDQDQYSNYEVVATNAKPTVRSKILAAGGDFGYYHDGSKIWFSAKHHPTVSATFTVREKEAKLRKVAFTINGKTSPDEDITGYNTANATKSNGAVLYKVGSEDKKVEADTITYTIADISRSGMNKTSQGKNRDLRNIITPYVTANSGNTNEETRIQDRRIFYIDDTAPVITKLDFAGNGKADYVDANGNIVGKLRATQTNNYGYYFKQRTVLTITATDFLTASGKEVNGCGVREIHAYLDPILPASSSVKAPIDKKLTNFKTLPTGEVSADLAINANFKGKIYLYAVDKVSNVSSNYYPDGTIVESEARHNATSDAKIEIHSTPVAKDNNGNDLFDSDVKFTMTVADKYSGLGRLSYTITSKWANGTDLGSGTVNIPHYPSSVPGWKILERDTGTNLVTKVSKDITLNSHGMHNLNDIVIHLEALDRAGYPITCGDKTISIDTTAPTITLTPRESASNVYAGDNKEYYSTSHTFDISVTERNFNPDDFTKVANITAREGSAPGIAGSSDWSTAYSDYSDSSTHTATITFSDDGDFTVELFYTDEAGNEGASVKSEDFVIDNIDPTITVTFDNNDALNGNYFKADRTATVTVHEHNFAEGADYIKFVSDYKDGDNATAVSAPELATSGWSSSGDDHTTTLNFDKDGQYAFTINYTDKAKRNATEFRQETFYIDKTKGKITFRKDYDLHAFGKQEVAPYITYTDNNLDAASSTYSLKKISFPSAENKNKTAQPSDPAIDDGATQKTVTYADFPDEEAIDGIYELNAMIVDKAGNRDSKKITFSVNRYGATYMGGDQNTDDLIKNGFTNEYPTLKITEINVTALPAYSVSVTQDTKTTELKEGTDYTVEKEGKDNASWYRYDYTINKENFENDGNYTLTLSSDIAYTDKKLNTQVTNRTAKTKNGNYPVSFVVDTTLPDITIDGVETNAVYREAEKDVKIVCLDSNINKESLVISVTDKDGKELSKDNYEYTVNDSMAGELDVDLHINAGLDDAVYFLKVDVDDLAKNTGEGKAENFTLSATFFTAFFHNIPLVIGSAVVLAALIGLAIFLLIKKTKKVK